MILQMGYIMILQMGYIMMIQSIRVIKYIIKFIIMAGVF